MNEAEKMSKEGAEYSGMLQCCGNGIGILLPQALSGLLYKAGNESAP